MYARADAPHPAAPHPALLLIPQGALRSGGTSRAWPDRLLACPLVPLGAEAGSWPSAISITTYARARHGVTSYKHGLHVAMAPAQVRMQS